VTTLGFDILARDKGATSAFQKIAKSADSTNAAMAKVAKVSDAAAAAGTRLQKAQAAEADALGKVRVAAAKLEEVRSNSKAKASQLAAAEEALAAAQRKATSASDAARSATKSLADAQVQAFDKIKNKADETAGKVGKSGKDAGNRFGAGFSQAIPGIGGRVSGFFKTGLGLAGGAALTGGVIAATGFIAGFNKALEQGGTQAKFQGQLGLTDAEAAKAGKVAGDLYTANYGESLGGVNDAIRSVVQNTNVGLNSVDLKPVTAQVLNLTSTFDQDLGGVTRAVGQLMRTGLVKDAGEALDVITKGFQSGADKSEDFLDTLNEYGTQFRKLGLNAETATGIISQGLKAGARDGDLVADALKEFSIRAIDGSKASAEGFKLLGLNAKTMMDQIAKGGKPATDGLDLVLDRLRGIKDPVEQSQAAVALFGTQAEDLGKALFAIDPSTAVEGLGKVSGAAGELDKTLGSTPQAVVTSFFRTLKQGSVDSLGGLITAFATGSTEADGFQGVMERAAVGAKKGFDKFSEIGTVVVDAAKGWGRGLISGVKSGLDTGDWSPLGKSLGGGISSAFDKVDWNKLGEKLGDVLIATIEKGAALSAKLGKAFTDLIRQVDWNKVGEDSTDSIGRFISGIDWGKLAKTLGVAVLGSLKINLKIREAVLDSAADLVTGIFVSISRELEAQRVKLVGWTAKIGSDLISGLWSGIKGAMKGVGDFIKRTIVDPVVGWARSLFGVRSPSTVFAKIGGELVAGLKAGIWAGAKGIGRWIYNAVIAPTIAPFAKAGSWLVQHGRNVLGGFWSGMVEKWKSVTKWIGGLKASVSAWLGNTRTFLAGKGWDVLQGFWDGMNSKWKSITDWVGSIATWIRDHKGPISLDAKLLVPAGQAIMSGFQKGLESGAGRTWDFVKSVGGKTKEAVAASYGWIKGLGWPDAFGSSKATLAGFGGGVARWAPTALQALRLTGSPESWLGSLLRRMNQESGGNPNAINLWDSNAKAGHPSQGLMQTIPGTFNAYAGAYRSRGITDPLANIIASINYANARYGSAPRGWDRPGGYKQGTPWVPNDQLAFLHKGEAVIPASVNRRLPASMPSSGSTVVNVYINGQVVDPIGTAQKIEELLARLKKTRRGRLAFVDA